MAKMKQCKECHAEIPKKAKKCMHCAAKQPQGMGLGSLLVIGFAVYFFFFAFPDAKDRAKQAALQPQPVSKPKAVDKSTKSYAQKMCMNRIRYSAKFPSSVDFSTFDSPPAQPMKGGGWVVHWAFEAKNGYGNMIPQSSRCEVKDGKIQHFKVFNR